MSLGSWLKKKSKSEQASPGLPIKFKIAIWYASKWFKDGLAGTKGEDVMQFLSKLQGLRSAILLLALIAEGICQSFGFSTGPLFALLHGLFASLPGWAASPDTVDLASKLVVFVTGGYAAFMRFKAWYAQHYGQAPAQP